VQWFGRDLTQVTVVFRETDVAKLARTLLRARRRKVAACREKVEAGPLNRLKSKGSFVK
jgi:hypothetical protein